MDFTRAISSGNFGSKLFVNSKREQSTLQLKSLKRSSKVVGTIGGIVDYDNMLTEFHA